MVTVKIRDDRKRHRTTLRMQGHAGADTEGKDLVCAAVSTLAYTLAQTMMCLYADGKLLHEPALRLEKGDVLVEVHPTTDGYAEVLYAFYVIRVGLALLAKTYPEYVRVE